MAHRRLDDCPPDEDVGRDNNSCHVEGVFPHFMTKFDFRVWSPFLVALEMHDVGRRLNSLRYLFASVDPSFCPSVAD